MAIFSNPYSGRNFFPLEVSKKSFEDQHDDIVWVYVHNEVQPIISAHHFYDLLVDLGDKCTVL